MKAHIQIVGWNHYQYIGTCILSCQKQTVKTPIVYVDNASKDDSVAYVRKNYPDVIVVENRDNRGYAGGHNDGIKTIPDSDVVICLNPDVVLESDFVEKIIQKFEQDEIASSALAASQRLRLGAVVPLLFREKTRGKNGIMRIIVDSYGTELKKNLNVANIMEGEFWEENYTSSSLRGARAPKQSLDNDGEIASLRSQRLSMPWGFTGAAVALSRSAINNLKDEKGNFFDEDLHSYREDVDASWRMRNQNWRIIGTTEARAWHARVARKGQKKSAHIARLSWRNFFLVAIKDVPDEMLKKHWLAFGIQVAERILQFFVTPALWGGFTTFVTLLPVFFKKRHQAL
jgi:GT2 family glycosyltransferase